MLLLADPLRSNAVTAPTVTPDDAAGEGDSTEPEAHSTSPPLTSSCFTPPATRPLDGQRGDDDPAHSLEYENPLEPLSETRPVMTSICEATTAVLQSPFPGLFVARHRAILWMWISEVHPRVYLERTTAPLPCCPPLSLGMTRSILPYFNSRWMCRHHGQMGASAFLTQ